MQHHKNQCNACNLKLQMLFISHMMGEDAKTWTEIYIFVHSSHLQNLLIKRPKFTLNPAPGAALWGRACRPCKDGCIFLELFWGRVLGTGEDLQHNLTCFCNCHTPWFQCRSFHLKRWGFVTLVAFLLPLILSTLAWASRIRSETLCSWWRFFSTLSETLQAAPAWRLCSYLKSLPIIV